MKGCLAAFAILVGFAALAAAGHHLVWQVRLSSAVKALGERGVPLTLAGLETLYPSVPARENAAEVYRQAFEAFRADESRLMMRAWTTYYQPFLMMEKHVCATPLKQEMKDGIAHHETANAAALEFLQAASLLRQCRFPVDLKRGVRLGSPLGEEESLEHLAKLRELSEMLALQVLLHAENQEPELACHRILLITAMSRLLENEPVLHSQRARAAYNERAFRALEQALNRTRFTDGQLQRLSESFASAECPQAMAKALEAEQAFVVLTGDAWLRDTVERNGGTLLTLLLKHQQWVGLMDRDKTLYVQLSSRLVDAARHPSPAALETGLALNKEIWGAFIPNAVFRLFFLGKQIDALETQAADVARMRIARTSLAVERWRAAKGSLPSSLADLVPDYLPSPLEDPFDGKPVRYRQTAKGYVVYSVGEDQQDDGGNVDEHSTGSDIALAVQGVGNEDG